MHKGLFGGAMSPDDIGTAEAGMPGGGSIHPGTLLLVAAPAFGDEAVAHPRFGLDVLLAGLSFELLAQLPDKDTQVLRLVSRLRSPDRGEQGAMGDDFAGVAGQMEQKIELFWRQMKGFPLHGDAVSA